MVYSYQLYVSKTWSHLILWGLHLLIFVLYVKKLLPRNLLKFTHQVNIWSLICLTPNPALNLCTHWPPSINDNHDLRLVGWSCNQHILCSLEILYSNCKSSSFTGWIYLFKVDSFLYSEIKSVRKKKNEKKTK